MFDLKSILEQELRYQQNLKQIYSTKVKGLPKGQLSVSNVKGKPYYYNRVNGERVYLGRKNNETVSAMQSQN